MEKIFIVIQNSEIQSLRKIKITFKGIISSLSSNVKKIEGFLAKSGAKLINSAPEKTGEVIESTGKIVKGIFGKIKYGNSLGDYLETKGSSIKSNKEKYSEKIKEGITKITDIVNATTEIGGNFTVLLAETIKGNLSDQEEKQYQKIGEVVTLLAIPGSAALATLLLTFDTEAKEVEEIANEDPESLEALARSITTINGNSTMEDVSEYLASLKTEDSLNEFINHTKLKLAEIELLKFLKENSENNINYSHVEDSSNEKFNLIGKNNLGEISETIKVQILEDPYSIYQTLENTNESTKIFINSELKEQFRINPKIIPTEISEKKLEERIIELFHKLKKDN